MMYLNHSKAELKKKSKSALVVIGHAILKRLPKTTLVNTVFNLEQLAKSKGIRSIGKIARKAGRKARKAGRKVRSRVRKRRGTKKGMRSRKAYSMYNGRRKVRKRGRLRKGSPEAKRYMAMIRSKRR